MIQIIKKILPDFLHPILRKCWLFCLNLINRSKESLLLIEVIYYKIIGKNFFDWYANRLNIWAAKTQKFKDKTSKANKDFLVSGKDDLNVLREIGLKKNHKLLECGCGWLRSAFHFINYLDKKNYCGVDPVKNRIEKGKEFFDIVSLNKAPKFFVIKDNSFNLLKGKKFDFLWCHAVFAHLPECDIEEIFINSKKLMKKNAKFVFTYHNIISHKKSKSLHKHFAFYNLFNLRDDVKKLNARDWHHKFIFYEKIGKKVGLKMEDYPEILKKYKSMNVDFKLCVATVK